MFCNRLDKKCQIIGGAGLIGLIVVLVITAAFFHSKFHRSLILEIEEMPKETFLKFIQESIILGDEEKKIIMKDISTTVYTHVRFTKYKQNRAIFLEIDQFYPRKLTGKDSAGHPQVIGGSGSISVYKRENDSWQLVSGMHYD